MDNDEELLRLFIGENYEKLTTNKFNWSGFFFTFWYMFYRKMVVYGLIVFSITLALLYMFNSTLVLILFNVIVGFSVNKIYLYYAKKQVTVLRRINNQKDINDLKLICSAAGGTSVKELALGILAQIGFIIVIMLIGFILAILALFVNLLNLIG